ncbi:MAG: HAMP domain-containing histidine kinase [Eubacterium sp.]|nr:HAMP domain-containing histidine kinase [Eubacterium sp.]
MKRFIVSFTILSAIVLLLPVILFLHQENEKITALDTVEVNELLSEIKAHWYDDHITYPVCSFDYAVIDSEERVLYKNGKSNAAETIVKATANRDTIRDIVVNDEIVGKVIIYNYMGDIEEQVGSIYIKSYLISVGFAYLVIILGIIWINLKVVRPFEDMKSFAEAVASGDLDKPLLMDKENMFGAFTESFDIMREELALSKDRELQANISKKELVAQLSHDLKTPVASIKAMAEVLEIKEEREPVKEKLQAIGGKADQIDRLVSDLFTSTLEELDKLEINITETDSIELEKMIQDSDYKNLIKELEIAECIVLCDKVRIGQVFNNIIYNSYKYASTDIFVKGEIDTDTLTISFTDRGGGVSEEELTLITQKYKRGSNATNKQGAGLGLFIGKELMENMQGSLEITNADGGLRVSLSFQLA